MPAPGGRSFTSRGWVRPKPPWLVDAAEEVLHANVAVQGTPSSAHGVGDGVVDCQVVRHEPPTRSAAASCGDAGSMLQDEAPDADESSPASEAPASCAHSHWIVGGITLPCIWIVSPQTFLNSFILYCHDDIDYSNYTHGYVW